MPASDAMGDAMGGASAGAAFGPWGAGAGALIGLGKYFAFDRPNYQKKMALTAATQRYSPWTGMSAQAPDAPNPLGAALGMGAAGAQMGQNISSANRADQMSTAYMNYLNKSSPATTGSGAAPSSTGLLPSSSMGTSPDALSAMYGPGGTGPGFSLGQKGTNPWLGADPDQMMAAYGGR